METALTYYQQSLTVAKKTENPQTIGLATSNVGSVYLDKEEFDTALKFFQQALVHAKETTNSQFIRTVLLYLARVCHKMGKIDQALNYYKRGLALEEKMGNAKVISSILLQMSQAYREKGDSINTFKYYQQGMTRRPRQKEVPDWARCFTIVEYKFFLDCLQAYGANWGFHISVDNKTGQGILTSPERIMGFPLHDLVQACKEIPRENWIEVLDDFFDDLFALNRTLRCTCLLCLDSSDDSSI